MRDYAASLGGNEKTALGLNPHPEEARSAVSKDEAEKGMREMSDKFNAMGQQVYIDADKVKAPHTTALDSEAAHAERNAGLVRQSNKAF